MKISVVINTFNSDRFLNQCLRSVEKFDEIVLCDMHSTDGTIAIAEKYGCRIVYHERTGIVEPARNYAIAQAENEWGARARFGRSGSGRAAGIPVPVRRNGRAAGLRRAENGA